ncbi:uroporphyrinogen-III synthase [Ramlibacter humi]|uniref:Uroporphyrinogen-III synthase n=1 Tax=Ramlibacter humi TaxID=2530451 RepID=A0A4Z0C0H7_9BURK|nr:uroporphyrinogen-III synthase [Ramlibacter humi]TFZ04030.1 uroporphyrinogen-III synthase [Ramlibacter humi]
MRVVLTRPAQDAAGWARDLRAAGHEVVSLPLIEIGPPPDADALARARQALGDFNAAMFVSANAVRGLLGERCSWPARMRAWATGPGTRDALLAAGIPAQAIDSPDEAAAQFDSEALWALVEGQAVAGARVLLLRGADATGEPAGRDWLRSRLASAGVQVETVATYSRRAPSWSAMQADEAARAAGGGAVWLFSSSEAIRNLAHLLPAQDWSRARAVATHERIAQAAREAGFGVVCPSRPGRAAVAAALESFG